MECTNGGNRQTLIIAAQQADYASAERIHAAMPADSGQRRPENPKGFDVNQVQRLAKRAATSPAVGPRNILADATITLPLSEFTKIEGMGKKISALTQKLTRRSLVDSGSVPYQRPTAGQYEMLRLTPDSVALDNVSSQKTILDTGASFSMVSREFMETCGLEGTTEDTRVNYLTADGTIATTTQMLKDVPIELGECYLRMDLAVNDNAAFDLLLGVDFTDNAQAVLHIRNHLVQVTQKNVTETVVFHIDNKGEEDYLQSILCNQTIPPATNTPTPAATKLNPEAIQLPAQANAGHVARKFRHKISNSYGGR